MFHRKGSERTAQRRRAPCSEATYCTHRIHPRIGKTALRPQVRHISPPQSTPTAASFLQFYVECALKPAGIQRRRRTGSCVDASCIKDALVAIVIGSGVDVATFLAPARDDMTHGWDGGSTSGFGRATRYHNSTCGIRNAVKEHLSDVVVSRR